jgi:6-phosphogluconolactonase/glucosamine-6-phosphate isomerase/deaminase
MKVIHAADARRGIEDMATRLSIALKIGSKVLWFVCGGSNVKNAVAVMELLRLKVSPEALANLTVALTDERYGQPGHKDSNWQQLIDAGFNFHKIATLPVLVGRSLDATVLDYETRIAAAFAHIETTRGLVIGLFGIGADGHIAGVLPGVPIVNGGRLVYGYEAGPFIRVTLTLKAIERFETAYAFVFGPEKEKALKDLAGSDLDLMTEPAQVLKKVPESVVYTDTRV